MRTEARPHETAGKGRASCDDENDDTDDVGETLGEHDGGRARDGDIVRLIKKQRLENFAHFTRRHREHEAGEKREQTIELRHATDAEASEIELPLEKTREIIPERERAP